VGGKTAESLWVQVSTAPGTEVKDYRSWLGECKAGNKVQKPLEQLWHTLDEIAPARKPLPPATMIRIILEAIYDDYLRAKYANHEQRREDLTTLENFARTFQDPVEFLSQLSLMATSDTERATEADEDSERVTLSTIHQAKGLEWRVVFVVWMADGMFPSSRSLETDEAIEEERRLFYVAVTRAKDELYLAYPYRWLNGSIDQQIQRPSRFLKEIPAELLEEWRVGV
ncbi:MAG: ATP-dependent helicase, partial [Chthoniobacterales bacterium]